ncbi:prepilin-type N-terminal cleavage/methylation domain-containing protein, partial [Achromobacter ruhlandii]|uniref:prepilin-type N-terminal cleavage/methylation domain-containing protein n=1 Tax=Achromobacter ruhlandii TaxID=72557 RepID=UPI0020166462
MPTSVRGNSERGFTLVEVLVVLVIVAIAASMVSLSIGKGADPLREDARRLADAFTVAEGEARSDGRPIRWLPTSGGWSSPRQAPPPAPPAPAPHLPHPPPPLAPGVRPRPASLDAPRPPCRAVAHALRSGPAPRRAPRRHPTPRP